MSSPALTGLFVPGWGAPARLYTPGLPEEWHALELPSFRKTRGELPAYRAWLGEEISGRGPVALAGHSMGAALALLAAVDRPDLVERLILLSPAGLPLTKPIPSSLFTWVRQVATGRFPLAQVGRSIVRVGFAPRSALRLGRVVHQLDLRPELEQFRANAVASTVVGLHDRHDDPGLALPRARRADRCGVRGGRRARRAHLAGHAPGSAQGRALTLTIRSPSRRRR